MESNSDGDKFGKTNIKKLLSATFAGIGLLIAPVALAYFDPVLRYAKYNLRLDNGSMMHELMRRPFHGLKLRVSVFNVTNAEEFLRGTDAKVRVQEVGPFVYQEIRTNEDIVINEKPGVMWLTPKYRTVFVPEESIRDPKDFYITIPNVPLMYTAALLGKYPYLVQQLFNFIVIQTKSKTFERTRVHDMLWGAEGSDPLIALANRLFPGLIYFKSFGLLNRLYDLEYDYRLEVGTTDSDKFAVKKSIRNKPNDNSSTVFVEKTRVLPNDTYEGEVFPQDLSPDRIINIFRATICRIFPFKYSGSRAMFYGGDAFVYKLHESFLNDRENCFNDGWCPSGLMNLAPCFWDLPAVVSKGHFLDADPRLLDLVEGLKPDRDTHDGEILIDPKVGVTVTGSMSLQVNMFLANVAFNPQTRMLQDTVIPAILFNVESPPLIDEALTAINFMHKIGPRILLSTQIFCVLFGLALLAYSARHIYLNWLIRNNASNLKKKSASRARKPLMMKYKIGS